MHRALWIMKVTSLTTIEYSKGVKVSSQCAYTRQHRILPAGVFLLFLGGFFVKGSKNIVGLWADTYLSMSSKMTLK